MSFTNRAVVIESLNLSKCPELKKTTENNGTGTLFYACHTRVDEKPVILAI